MYRPLPAGGSRSAAVYQGGGELPTSAELVAAVTELQLPQYGHQEQPEERRQEPAADSRQQELLPPPTPDGSEYASLVEVVDR